MAAGCEGEDVTLPYTLLRKSIQKRDNRENNNGNTRTNKPMLQEMGEEGEKERDTYKLCLKVDTSNANLKRDNKEEIIDRNKVISLSSKESGQCGNKMHGTGTQALPKGAQKVEAGQVSFNQGEVLSSDQPLRSPFSLVAMKMGIFSTRTRVSWPWRFWDLNCLSSSAWGLSAVWRNLSVVIWTSCSSANAILSPAPRDRSFD